MALQRLENLTRRGFLGTALVLSAAATLPETLNAQQTNDIPLRVVSKNYELKLIAANLQNPGELALSPRNTLYFVHRTPDGEEGIYELTSQGIYFKFPNAIKLGECVERTKLAANNKDAVFVYQSNGLRESLRVFQNGRGYGMQNPFLGKPSLLQQVRAISANPLDNKLYLPLWGEREIHVLDPDKKTLEKWAEGESLTQASCFNQEACLFMLNQYLLTRSSDKVILTKIDREKRKSEIQIINPLTLFNPGIRGSFAFSYMRMDNDEGSLVFSGSFSNGTDDNDCLIKYSFKTRELVPIALTYGGQRIKGIEIGKSAIYLSLSKYSIISDSEGRIVSLRKKTQPSQIANQNINKT